MAVDDHLCAGLRFTPRNAVFSHKIPGSQEIHCSIHLDLLAAKHIPDPFIGLNESKLQWVHDKTWIYTTTFEGTAVQKDERVDLVFDGLDTFATVKLNGDEILTYAPNTQVGSIR